MHTINIIQCQSHCLKAHLPPHVQVCGVFALFLTGAHHCIVAGLYCYPRLKVTAVSAYFATAIVGALAGLTAKNKVGRALPMLALLLIRFSVVVARLVLHSGSHIATLNFLCLEVKLKTRVYLLMHKVCTVKARVLLSHMFLVLWLCDELAHAQLPDSHPNAYHNMKCLPYALHCWHAWHPINSRAVDACVLHALRSHAFCVGCSSWHALELL